MVFLFEIISEHYLRTVRKTGCLECFQAKTAKNVFHEFFLDFWADVFEIFYKDFLLTIKSKKAIFGDGELEENCKSIFSKLYSPSNNILFFYKLANFVEKIMGCITEILWLKITV